MTTVGEIIDFSHEPKNHHDLSPRVYQHQPRGWSRFFPIFSRDRFVVENICHRCEHALR